MTMLILGILLFAAVHFIPSLAPGLKGAWVRRLGENGYKGVFSLLLLAALGLIIAGWRSAEPTFIYTPPRALHMPALALIALGFLLFVASNRRSRLKLFIRHPQLTGVAAWGIGHLMLNGDSRSAVLFGGLILWSLGEMLAINHREGVWIKGDAPSAGYELGTVAAAALVFLIVVFIHPWLAGVPVRW